MCNIIKTFNKVAAKEKTIKSFKNLESDILIDLLFRLVGQNLINKLIVKNRKELAVASSLLRNKIH